MVWQKKSLNESDERLSELGLLLDRIAKQTRPSHLLQLRQQRRLLLFHPQQDACQQFRVASGNNRVRPTKKASTHDHIE